MIISTMSLANFLIFFQHLMKNILCQYLWKCLLIYIDDIIIFFNDKKSHLIDLNDALQQLKFAEFTLFLVKCHFVFLFLNLLDHKISHLSLFTQKEKIKTIFKLIFFKTLQHLKTDVELFKYYWKFVNHFTNIIDSLFKLKTHAFKNVSQKDSFWQKYVNKMFRDLHINSLAAAKIVWEIIKKCICFASILKFSDFFKLFLLYCDDFKKRKLRVTIYQFDDEENKQSVLFLFHILFSVKEKFHFTKLEITVLIWALRKTSQYFNNELFKIIIDYNALKSALQTTSFN